MRLIQCEQGTTEWFEARVGVITASEFVTARDKLKSGEMSQKAKDYGFKKALERISGEVQEDTYQTFAMKRGREMEGFARAVYEEIHDVEVVESGIAISDCGYFGYSTDGFVGATGGVEIKSLMSPKTILPVLEGDLSDFIDQIQGGIWIADLEWMDFILYLPQLKSLKKDMNITRVYRDEAYIKQLKSDLDKFNDYVWSLINRFAA
jgi:exodeoxyribonuclease (lambda-induced)